MKTTLFPLLFITLTFLACGLPIGQQGVDPPPRSPFIGITGTPIPKEAQYILELWIDGGATSNFEVPPLLHEKIAESVREDAWFNPDSHSWFADTEDARENRRYDSQLSPNDYVWSLKVTSIDDDTGVIHIEGRVSYLSTFSNGLARKHTAELPFTMYLRFDFVMSEAIAITMSRTPTPISTP